MSWKGPLEESISYEWREIVMKGGRLPAIRTGATSCLHDGQMYVFCGFGAGVGRSSDVWCFNIEEGLWTVVKSKGNNSDKPSKRDGHSTTDIGNGRVLLFGGQGEPSPNEKSERTLDIIKTKTWSVRDLQNDLFEFDCKTHTWKMLCPEGGVPLCRRGHSAVFFPKGGYSEAQVNVPHTHSHAHVHSSTLGGAKSGGAHSPGKTGSSSSHHKKGGHDEPQTEEYLPIPENSLVVYGGSGMEVSKYIEAVYNDVWVYNLDVGRWSKVRCRGIEPKPLFDHRCVRVGHVMLVLGGITGANAKSSGGPMEASENHDIMMLNLKTLVWSYVDIVTNHGKAPKFNLHGHSLVTDPYEAGIAYLFGGKDTVDGKRAALESVAGARKLLKRPNEGHAWVINLNSGTMSPMPTDNPPPENRYEHITQRVGFEGQLIERPPAPKRKAGVREEPLMYIFGGARSEMQGLCDPLLHSLVRVYTYREPDLISLPGGSKAPADNKAGAGDQHSPDFDDASISTHHTADASSVYTNPIEADIDEDLRQPSIWEKRQIMDINLGRSALMRTPSSWTELKLALSTSLTDKRSAHLGAASASAAATGGGHGSSGHASPTPESRPATANLAGSADTGATDVDSSAQSKDRDGDSGETSVGLSAKQKQKKEIARLEALGRQVLPIVKGKCYKDAKDAYFRKFPAPIPADRIYSINASTSLAMALTKSTANLKPGSSQAQSKMH